MGEAMRYRVIAPVVVCKVMSNEGLRYEHLHTGAPVPAEAEEAWIGYHLRDNMIAPIPEDPAPEEAPAEPEAAPPAPPPASPPAAPPAASPVRGASRAKSTGG